MLLSSMRLIYVNEPAFLLIVICRGPVYNEIKGKAVDPAMRDYSWRSRCVTPNGNLKAFGHQAEEWGRSKSQWEISINKKICLIRREAQ